MAPRPHPSPALPPEVAVLPHRLSSAVHLLLYPRAFVTPLVGIVTFIWHGRAFDLGLFRVDFGARSNRANFHPTEDVHGYLAYVLVALVSIHLFTALWHPFAWRHRLLQRMWPAVRPGCTAGRSRIGVPRP